MNMADKPKLKYEKPVSLDLGRIAPVLGDRCSDGSGAEDCGFGFENTSIPACGPTGAGATNWCQTGSSAVNTCYTTGSSAGAGCQPGSSAGFCFAGSGF